MACGVDSASSFVNHEREMEMQLSCSVCLELFTDPVLLPCLHSLCRGCVERLTTHGEVETHTFRCPECNVDIQVGPGGHRTLKRNFPLSSMVAIYRQSTRHRQKNSVVKPNNLPTVKEGDVVSVQQGAETNGHNIAPKNNITTINNISTQNLSSHEELEVSQSQHSTPASQQTLDPSSPQQTASPSSQTTDQTVPAAPQTDREASRSDAAVSVQTPQVPAVEIPTTCSTCDVRKTRKTDVYCETCLLAFCRYCLDIYHPEGIGHRLLPFADQQASTQPKQDDADVECPICDPASPRKPSVRCLECEMIFCDQCLQQYHPTTKTVPGHTLVEIRSKPDTNRSTAGTAGAVGTGTGGGAGTGAGPRAGAAAGGGTESQNGPDRQQSRHSGSSVNAFGAHVPQMAIGGLAHLATRFPCSTCQVTPTRDSSFKCLDCSSYLCEGCVHAHQTEFPNHSLIDIRLDAMKKPIPAPRTQSTSRTAHKPVNVQLKLVELMGIRADAMTELLNVLEGRRALLEVGEGRARASDDYHQVTAVASCYKIFCRKYTKVLQRENPLYLRFLMIQFAINNYSFPELCGSLIGLHYSSVHKHLKWLPQDISLP